MHKALGICDNAAGIPSWSELHCPGTRLRLPILVRCRLIVWSVYEAEPVSGQEHHSRSSRRPSLWIRYRRDFRHYGCPHAELPALAEVIGEIAPARLRGRLVGVFQFNVVFGILLAYFSNYLIGLRGFGAAEWRWELGVTAIPAALFFLMLFGIPRSPRWLAKKGRITEAR